ncbi:MAG: UDP-2,3-diacylglucosamine diphosphatase [Planctomycetes bacterium]|nr:UDP-2,3-diacylglucosamine diphosphatase [Planctomycetota bacterium]
MDALTGDVVLTADVHLGDEGEREELFLKLLEKYRELPVLVLGDLFSYWYERWGRVPSRYRGFLEKIAQSERTEKVYLIPGNRDLLAGKALERLSGNKIARVHDTVKIKSRSVALTHGDLLTRWDGHYRLYRFLLSSGLMALLARMVPEFLAEKVVFGLKRASAADKRRRGDRMLNMELREAAKLLGDDIEGVVCGHFHPEYLVTYRGLKNWVRILPDWGRVPGNHAVLTAAGAFRYYSEI